MRIWSTPQPVFDKLNDEFQFTIDLCADIANRKCDPFIYTEHSLSVPWTGIGWLNPPYGEEIWKYLKKARESTKNGSIIVAIVPGRTNAPWWHRWIMQADEIRFVRKKMSFVSNDGKKGVPSWGAVIAVYRPNSECKPQVSTWDQP